MRRDPKADTPNFFSFAREYLHIYLPTVQRRSPKTIEAYRISLECFLDYLAEREHVERADVSFDDFDRQHLKAWLAWMSDQRHYAPKTVALRLSAVKAFLTYCSYEDLTLVALSQAARALRGTDQPQKAHRVPQRSRDTGRPRRFRRPHGKIAQEQDAAHPALRHRCPRQ